MKKQLKKSLSLFLAVLMLMTCWVWVAPQKAEAGAPGGYDVTIDFNCIGEINGGRAHADIYYITNNGTGSVAGPITWELDKLESTTGTYSLTYSNVPGWPCQVYVHCGDQGMREFEIAISGISVNGTKVHTGTYTLKAGWWSSDSRDFIPNTKDNASADGQSGTVSGNNEGEWNWKRPVLDTATATFEGNSHALNKVNSGIISKSTISVGGFVDDYGVNWKGPLNTTFTLRTDGNVTIDSSHAVITGSGTSRTIEIRPWFQTLFPAGQKAKLYVDWNVNNYTKSGTETIELDFPEYTATFYANGAGAEIGEDVGSKDEDGIIVHTDEKMTYGAKIGAAPGYAYREGFEFMGYYSRDN
ncbi:MAG: hypothetical protein II237_07740, partial [Clostridia bacterium]|nr:hypothetical protein [Clostridia bacterium]